MMAMSIASLVQPGWSIANESEINLQPVGAYAKEFGE